MQLSDHITDIQYGIRTGRFVNEASISQGIVLRLLQVLGWPTYDTQIVCPEYTVENRRVDYALCHPKTKPSVFVEVKQIGLSEGAERQLFEYAFHLGVPMAILTDGQEWQFFLPAEQGLYQERRVYKLDLLERSIDESVMRLQRYLTYEDVCSGKAIDSARLDYRNVSRERTILTTLPTAWRKLIEEQDSLLLELLIDKVESLCGYRPDEDTVSVFLAQHLSSMPAHVRQQQPPPAVVAPTSQHHQKRPQTPVIPPATTPVKESGSKFGFSYAGKYYPATNAKDVLIKVFELLGEQDKSFLERFAARPKHGRKRRYLAASPNELYPDRPDLVESSSQQLRSGWWVGTNISKAQIETILHMACEVAGIKYGQDLSTDLD